MALNKHNNYLYLSLILDNFKTRKLPLHYIYDYYKDIDVYKITYGGMI